MDKDVVNPHKFGVTLSEIVGKKAEMEMMEEGRKSLEVIAKRLPDTFDDFTEDELIEMFRQASLFMISNGLSRSEYANLKNEKDTSFILKLCPDFPVEQIDAFCKLYDEYSKKWMKQRREEFRRICRRD